MTAVAASGVEPRRRADRTNPFVRVLRLPQAPMILALIVVVLFFQLATGYFLRAQNISNLLVEMVPLALIAIASAIMILMGEIDLSLGSVAGFTAALGVSSMANLGWSWQAGLLVFVVAGVAVGALQGLIVVLGKIRSFVLTLAGYLVFYGVQLALLGPSSRVALPTSPLSNLAFAKLPLWVALTIVVLLTALLAYQAVSRWRHHAEALPHLLLRLIAPVVALLAGVVVALYLEQSGGFPLQFAILVILIVVVWFVLTQTVGGRHLYAVGGNPKAARENGIRTGLVRWTGFLVAGGLAGLAGLALASYTSGADSTTGTGSLLLSGIGAAVIGGISLLGGRGSVWGAFCGAILLAAVQNGLNLMALANYLIYIVQGLVVLGALLLDANIRRRLVSS
ncbi:ABC transporter permease subunit [Microbacterium tumbae]